MRRLSRRSANEVQAKGDHNAETATHRRALMIEASAYSQSRLSISRENLYGPVRASATSMHGIEKRIVYIIRSDVDRSRHYVGITNDLRARFEWHNHGPCGHTLSYRPWSVVVSLEFPTEKEAVVLRNT